jgi:hypothetical protein
MVLKLPPNLLAANAALLKVWARKRRRRQPARCPEPSAAGYVTAMAQWALAICWNALWVLTVVNRRFYYRFLADPQAQALASEDIGEEIGFSLTLNNYPPKRHDGRFVAHQNHQIGD